MLFVRPICAPETKAFLGFGKTCSRSKTGVEEKQDVCSDDRGQMTCFINGEKLMEVKKDILKKSRNPEEARFSLGSELWLKA